MSGLATMVEKFKRLGCVLRTGSEPSQDAVSAAAEDLLIVAMRTVPIIDAGSNLAGQVSNILRAVYDDTIKEGVPSDFKDLVNRLGKPNGGADVAH